MTADIVDLSDHQKPVSYTIDVMHHYSGKVEIFVRDVSDDARSVNAVISFIIKWASQHMKERDIHVAMLERIDQLMDAKKDTPEARELSVLASACAAYEREAFPNVLSQDNGAEDALQGQYDVYAAAREEYRKKISEQAQEIEKLRGVLREIEMVPAVEMLTDFHAKRKMVRLARAALLAGLRAWPGMSAKQSNEHVALFDSEPAIILPMQETSDE